MLTVSRNTGIKPNRQIISHQSCSCKERKRSQQKSLHTEEGRHHLLCCNSWLRVLTMNYVVHGNQTLLATIGDHRHGAPFRAILEKAGGTAS